MAHSFCATTFDYTTHVTYGPGESFPDQITSWQGNWIFSFKSDLILPDRRLATASDGAINIHPATPEFRGVGGYYYALENKHTEFGVTAHEMAQEIDAGKILEVRRFPLRKDESAESLEYRAGAYCLVLFWDLLSLITEERNLPQSCEAWEGKLNTRQQLADHLSVRDV
jgi:methionyl-tRNA formyltransferase